MDEFLLVDESLQPTKKPSLARTTSSSTSLSNNSNNTNNINSNNKNGIKNEKEEEDGDEFVLLDESQGDSDDPYATLKYQQQLSSSSLTRISDAFTSSESQNINNTNNNNNSQEGQGPLIRNRSVDFRALRKEMQGASDEQYALYLARIQPIVHKTVSDSSNSLSLSSLSDSLASSLLGGITWSAASTWKTCSQCGQYFDRLARIHTCKICQVPSLFP